MKAAAQTTNHPTPSSEALLFSEPVEWLRQEYLTRRLKNPHYSLRAFARYLGIASGPLSEILSKKRTLTSRQLRKIADRLGYTQEEQTKLLKANRPNAATVESLDNDTFALIADWYHFALLSLLQTSDCVSNIHWLARRLNLSEVEVRTALERMERLGMVSRQHTQQGEHYEARTCYETAQKIPSAAARKYHRQSLEQALTALEDIPVEERDVTSTTIAVDPNKLEEARRMIKQFRVRLAKLLEGGKQTEVFKLNIQLFPLTTHSGGQA